MTLDTPLIAEEKDAKESSALNLMEHDAASAQSPAHHADTPDNSTKDLFAIAAGYLTFTLTDSAIRMVILLQLFLLGFGDKTPLTLAAIFNKGPLINQLSLARLFLFVSRDVWFEVVLPVYLRGILTWSYFPTGFFLAAWVIVYAIIQASAPALLRPLKQFPVHGPGGPILARWSAVLAVMTVVLALGTSLIRADKTALVWGGWGGAGVVSDGEASGFVVGEFPITRPPHLCASPFAILSSLHSFLIVAYSGRDIVAQNVGFYYMANAAGRLVGCLASEIVYVSGRVWGAGDDGVVC
ncbi:hypothetical protein M427DRAFT_32499 [Gonapodya prolifera JEL478]|uniref:Uncharacterized protein n=1 Tax=Gonapodya prolifera (strain JEL478) TaxID=1344416 RepID=A0A139AEN2_GONPJ|nr:hypothetical protein M427DRAFT_32499 [Gonapodya prolifera JEL478]|eukprot:KXS15286.1 hypothetical protein M427DRAFT_32499 [Gonapodya prolifera JEL478]